MNWPANFLESGVTRYISTDVPSVQETSTTQEVVQKLEQSPYGVVLLTSPEGQLKGIITRNDLSKLGQSTPPKLAKDLATTSQVIAILNSAQVWQLLKIMNGENATRKLLDVLPVVDKDRKPVGIILRDTLRQQMPKELILAGA